MNIIIFAILTLGQNILLAGGLTNVSEAFALGAVLVAAFVGRSPLVKEEATLLSAILGLLLILGVHDILTGGITEKTFKVAAHYLVLAAYVVILRKALIIHPKRVVLFLFLLTFSELWGIFSGISTARTVGDPWQLALAGPISAFIFSLVAYLTRARKFWLIATLLALAGLHTFFAARSLALGALMTIVLVFLWNHRRRSSANRMAAKMMVFGTLLIGLIGIGVDASMRNGVFGTELRDQYVQQASSTYGLIGGSRPQFLVGSIAALDRPLFGFGTHQESVAPYYVRLLVYDFNNSPFVNEVFMDRKIDGERIPSHSTIIDAWLLFGILGVAFWVWIMYRIIRILFHALVLPGISSTVVIFFAPQMLWALVFNPGPDRLMFSIGFAFFLAFDYRKGLIDMKHRKAKVSEEAKESAYTGSTLRTLPEDISS